MEANANIESKIDLKDVMAELKGMTTELAGMNTKITELAADVKSIKSKFRKLKKFQNEAQHKLEKNIEDLERRFKAKDTFPSSSLYSNPPKSSQAPINGSVSMPKWGKRSIYG